MGMAADWGGTVTERTSCRPRELHPSWGVRSRGRQEVRCGVRLVAPCRERPAAPQRRCLRLPGLRTRRGTDRKSTRLNSSHVAISYAVFCLIEITKARAETRLQRRND